MAERGRIVMATSWLCSSSAPPLLLLWLHLALLVLRPAIAAAANNNSSSLTNLVENGSFEEGTWSPTDGLTDEIVCYPSPQRNDITGWMVANGSIDWARNRWKRASDCSAAIIDLSGKDRGIVNTSFQTTPNTNYTILLDTAPNPSGPTPVKGNFTVTVLSGDASVNSSDVSVDGHGYDSNNIGWHTFAVFFTSPSTSQGNLTLRLSSNIPGWYGPLIDNVRVYEGLQYVNSEKDATCPEDAKSKVTLIVAIVVVPLVLVILLCIGLSLWWKRKRSNFGDEEDISHLEGRLQIFPYGVLKAATQNFHQGHKLGAGTFGAVYKGTLADGNEVAVKQLFTKTPQGHDEFINEATVISSVRHRNLVTLKGCCAKGLERFLVYEYMENKSLYQVLWGDSEGALIHLNWATRFRITLGTARGLAYLHEASQPRIIHRDIKASNILLDGNFEAKIADFGLAKFFPDDKTHVSTRVAGTLGYLAPEYALKGQLSEKADVFSFGIVALELVSGRKNLDYRLPLDTQYLLDWAKQLFNQGRIMEDLIDPELQAEGYPTQEVERVIKAGLFCTQEVAAMRPTMSEVLSLLQGSSEKDETEWSYVGKSGVHHLEGASIPLLMSSSFSISSCTLDNTTSTASSSTG